MDIVGWSPVISHESRMVSHRQLWLRQEIAILIDKGNQGFLFRQERLAYEPVRALRSSDPSNLLTPFLMPP